MNILTKIGAAFIGLISILGIGVPAQTPQIPAQLGATIPQAPALVDTYLATNIGASDTSMTLANGTTFDGTPLSGTYCFTIDVNQPTLEYVRGVASGTSVTSLVRGISPSNPNTTSTALAYPHRRFASVQITDYCTLQAVVRQLSGQDAIGSSTPLYYDTGITTSSFTNANQIISKGYADAIAFASAPNGNLTTKGIYQEATPAQTASGTAVGSTGADLIAPNKYFNTTSTATTTIPVTGSNGKLSQGFIDLTQPFTFSGGVTSTGAFSSTGTTTIQGYTISTSTSFSRFGGTGADGALSISSGTTTLDLGGAAVFIKNYSSISITGTGALAFTNPNTNGTIIVLKSAGNVTITSSASPAIDLRNIGGAGGTGGAYDTGGWGGFGYGLINNVGGGYGGSRAGIGGGTGIGGLGVGASGSIYGKAIIAYAGGGGGGGAQDSGAGGAGGMGAGGIYIECGGLLNITSTINASGSNGSNGGSGSGTTYTMIGGGGGGSYTQGGNGASASNNYASGGGGGGGGSIIILYNGLTTNTGTYTVSGGTGGLDGWGSANSKGGNGANGFYSIVQNTEF